MKKFFLSIILTCAVATTFAQKINYQPTFDKALDKAAEEKKLVLVIINPFIPKSFVPPPGVKSPTFFRSGIDDAKSVEFINKNFIPFAMPMSDSLAVVFQKKYSLTKYPAYLFIDGHNNPVYQDNSNSPTADKYIAMGEKALEIAASGKTISDYQAQYLIGNNTAESLKEYIMLNQSMGIYDNAKLVDDYVDQLTIKSFQDYQTVLFVLEAGPYAYGKAYNLCYTNRKITDSIFKYEPTALRIAINDRILNNTSNEAIKLKNVYMAQQAANHVAGTWRNNNPRQGAIASQTRMLQYYAAVKDTASYFRQATYFYDGYYMSISADSARKKQQATQDNIRASALARQQAFPTQEETVIGPDSVKRTVRRTTMSQIVGPVNPINATANTLNGAAWQFYILGTQNQNNLTKAIIWSKRSIELDPRSSYYDTLAHLLYRMGFYGEAQISQNKAIELAEIEGADKGTIERFKGVLTQIKGKKL